MGYREIFIEFSYFYFYSTALENLYQIIKLAFALKNVFFLILSFFLVPFFPFIKTTEIPFMMGKYFAGLRIVRMEEVNLE